MPADRFSDTDRSEGASVRVETVFPVQAHCCSHTAV